MQDTTRHLLAPLGPPASPHDDRARGENRGCPLALGQRVKRAADGFDQARTALAQGRTQDYLSASRRCYNRARRLTSSSTCAYERAGSVYVSVRQRRHDEKRARYMLGDPRGRAAPPAHFVDGRTEAGAGLMTKLLSSPGEWSHSRTDDRSKPHSGHRGPAPGI